MPFDPPILLTVLFVLLTFVLLAIELGLVVRVAPEGMRVRFGQRAGLAMLAWLTLFVVVAGSGVLRVEASPPRVLILLATNALVAIGLALSPLGKRLAGLPLEVLVGVQVFRLPLEMILHGLYSSGDLPVQMTWSGRNFDVLTGLTAGLLFVVSRWGELPRWVLWLWNVVGLALLVNVVTIAVLSTPTALRVFTEGPAVWLPYHAPFNWIVGVHVFTALAGHVVVFRALLRRPRPLAQP